jgi:phosphoserine aminotransferase
MSATVLSKKSTQLQRRSGNSPAEVLRQSADACINFDNLNLSLLEISHRSKNYEAVNR